MGWGRVGGSSLVPEYWLIHPGWDLCVQMSSLFLMRTQHVRLMWFSWQDRSLWVLRGDGFRSTSRVPADTGVGTCCPSTGQTSTFCRLNRGEGSPHIGKLAYKEMGREPTGPGCVQMHMIHAFWSQCIKR